MSKSKAKQLFEQATEELNHAKQEQNRPSSDVVSFSACVATRKSLYHFLEGLANIYAEKHDDTLEEDGKIETLIDFCSKYNEKIKNLDFSEINCKCDDLMNNSDDEIVLCTSVEKVRKCTKLAEEVHQIVTSI